MPSEEALGGADQVSQESDFSLALVPSVPSHNALYPTHWLRRGSVAMTDPSLFALPGVIGGP